MMFYVVLLVLALAAAGFVLLPLLRRPTADQDDLIIDRNQINIALYEERVEELAVEGEADELALDARRDLLLDVVEEDQAPVGQQRLHAERNTRWYLLAPALLLPLLAFIAYVDVGLGRGAFVDYELSRELRNIDPQDTESYLELVDRFASRAADRTGNTDLQFMAARMLTSAGRFETAAEFYNRLFEQFPGEADLASMRAETLFLADQRQWTPRVEQAVSQALALNPADITMLEVSGMGAISSGDMAEALNWFRKAAAAGASGRRLQLLQSAIGQLESQLGAVADQAPDAGRSIRISVSAVDGITLPEQSTVFVYARALQGPPMPLAVQRLTLGQLPATVLLDDSMSMMPGMSLKDFDQVQVIARVSSTGEVTPSPGDFEAKSDALDVTDGPIDLELRISEQLTGG